MIVDRLRCEYRDSPEGIDCPQPRLGWALESSQRAEIQTACQIVVASSRTLLEEDKGDLWDSGKVASDATCQIPYSGKKLSSGEQCFWKVRVWDKRGKASEWSKPAGWSMGLTRPDDWKAKWIGFDSLPEGVTKKPEIPPVPFMRKEFNIDKPVKRAMLYVSALGLYEMHLNGKKVGNDYLTPGDCDFRKRTYYRFN